MGGLLLAFWILMETIWPYPYSVYTHPDHRSDCISPEELVKVHGTFEEFGIEHTWIVGPKGECYTLNIMCPDPFRGLVEEMLFPRAWSLTPGDCDGLDPYRPRGNRVVPEQETEDQGVCEEEAFTA